MSLKAYVAAYLPSTDQQRECAGTRNTWHLKLVILHLHKIKKKNKKYMSGKSSIHYT